VPRFEVGIREAKTGQMMNREWSRAELEQSAAWLKRMNAKGNDVYIRPAGEHGLVLVDDLAAGAGAHEGGRLRPAATIETSPGNYQAWVKLSDKPLSADVRRIAAQGWRSSTAATRTAPTVATMGGWQASPTRSRSTPATAASPTYWPTTAPARPPEPRQRT
jgi:hypothetical protein